VSAVPGWPGEVDEFTGVDDSVVGVHELLSGLELESSSLVAGE